MLPLQVSPNNMKSRYELIYTSVMTTDTSIAEVADIARVSHRYNKHHDLAGLLLFDGERFCHYVEGEEAEVKALMRKIELDRRHENIVVRHEGVNPGPRLFPKWSMGYVLMRQGRRLDRFEGVSGFAAVELLLELQDIWEITWFDMG